MSMSHWVRKLFTTRRPRPIRRFHAPVKKTTLGLEQMEEKVTPATLDVTGGVLTFTATAGEANNLTISLTGTAYAFNDSVNKITLTANAMTAGFKGSNTFSVSGQDSKVDSIIINLGDGNDTINLRNTNDPVTINSDGGSDSVNIS